MSRSTYSISEILRGVLPRGSHKRIYSVDLIRLKWVDIVGTELALRSEPTSLGVGVLTIRVSDATWGRMLLKLQRDILGRLQRLVGASVVGRIQFLRDGKKPWDGGDPPSLIPEKAPTFPKPLPDYLVEEARSIGDEALRDLVTRTAARYLTAQADRRR